MGFTRNPSLKVTLSTLPISISSTCTWYPISQICRLLLPWSKPSPSHWKHLQLVSCSHPCPLHIATAIAPLLKYSSYRVTPVLKSLQWFPQILRTKPNSFLGASNVQHQMWPAHLWSYFLPLSTIFVGSTFPSVLGICHILLLLELCICSSVCPQGTTRSSGQLCHVILVSA